MSYIIYDLFGRINSMARLCVKLYSEKNMHKICDKSMSIHKDISSCTIIYRKNNLRIEITATKHEEFKLYLIEKSNNEEETLLDLYADMEVYENLNFDIHDNDIELSDYLIMTNNYYTKDFCIETEQKSLGYFETKLSDIELILSNGKIFHIEKLSILNELFSPLIDDILEILKRTDLELKDVHHK